MVRTWGTLGVRSCSGMVSMPAFSTLAPLDWLLMPGRAIPRICLAPDLLPAVLAVLLLDKLTLSASREEPPDEIKLVLEADPWHYNQEGSYSCQLTMIRWSTFWISHSHRHINAQKFCQIFLALLWRHEDSILSSILINLQHKIVTLLNHWWTDKQMKLDQTTCFNA